MTPTDYDGKYFCSDVYSENQSTMSGKKDRPRGGLTGADKKFLRGEQSYENRQQSSDRRRGIRKRITNSILDFNLIQYSLEDRDRKRIFRDPATAAYVDDPLFLEGIRSMFYWTYFGLKEQNYNFENSLVDAIERAEEDFARKYWGDSVDVNVRFDVDVTQSHDLDDLITTVERGGPVQANALYNLLEMSGGVPIDTSRLDTVRVWFSSSYPEGEKAVLETLFSEYLDTEVEIEDAVARVDVSELGFERESAVIDTESSRPDPSEIKNYSSSIDDDFDETIEEIRLQEMVNSSTEERTERPENDDSILDSTIDEMVDWNTSSPPSIYDLIDEREEHADRDEPVTPEVVFELLEEISDDLVSTIEVAAALGCAPDAARQALSALLNERRVERQSVIDSNRNSLSLWSIKSDFEQEEQTTD